LARDDFLEGGCGVGVESDDSFGVDLADRDPEPRMSVGVVVEAVDGQAPDLVPPGARPAQQEQRGPLQRVGEILHGAHQGVDLLSGEVAGSVSGRRGVSRLEISGRLGTSLDPQIAVSRQNAPIALTSCLRVVTASGLPLSLLRQAGSHRKYSAIRDRSTWARVVTSGCSRVSHPTIRRNLRGRAERFGVGCRAMVSTSRLPPLGRRAIWGIGRLRSVLVFKCRPPTRRPRMIPGKKCTVTLYRVRIERKFDDDYLEVREILQPGEAREAHAALARDWRSAGCGFTNHSAGLRLTRPDAGLDALGYPGCVGSAIHIPVIEPGIAS